MAIKQSEPLQEKIITPENLKKHWNTFAQNLKNCGKINEYVIIHKDVILKDGHIVVLHLDNLVQLDQLNSFKAELLQYLREQLQNNRIMIEPVLSEQKEEKKLYTDSDKFAYLAELNPLLIEMKNRLSLDM
ncbi:MAG: hypothetical protein NZ529_09765 [Cytophagaceae bacterium]|nr:hypothetical protein [Cytophagaceae bacterium]MDW8457073.1 hypothetical protein [Cytophagaceae bacterium]